MRRWWCEGLGENKDDRHSTEWVQQLFLAVRLLLPKDFVGRIEINCHKGDIGNINVIQSFKAGGETMIAAIYARKSTDDSDRNEEARSPRDK